MVVSHPSPASYARPEGPEVIPPSWPVAALRMLLRDNVPGVAAIAGQRAASPSPRARCAKSHDWLGPFRPRPAVENATSILEPSVLSPRLRSSLDSSALFCCPPRCRGLAVREGFHAARGADQMGLRGIGYGEGGLDSGEEEPDTNPHALAKPYYGELAPSNPNHQTLVRTPFCAP